MYDTIGLNSPPLSEDLACLIEQKCIRREGVDLSSGEILYQITTGELKGSYDYRIRINVKRYRWNRDNTYYDNKNIVPTKVSSQPYLYVECSVHKAMIGHNVYGGPCNIKASCWFIINLLSDLLEIDMPDYRYWEIVRADVTEIYMLESFDVVQAYFQALNNASFPRRSVKRDSNKGLWCTGATTQIKIYHKGPEFQKHDRKRLKEIFSNDEIFRLQAMANNIIRVEVEVKSRKFRDDFGRLLRVEEISDVYLQKVHRTEILRLLKEGKSDMEQVRTSSTVERRLHYCYSDNLANILLGFWSQLSIFGEDKVSKMMPYRTYARKRKQLIDAGISWKGTDVYLSDYDIIPADFSPVPGDRRNLVEMEPRVRLIVKDFERLAS